MDSSFLGIYKFFSRSVRSLLSIFLLIYNKVPPLVDSGVKYSLYPAIDVSYVGFCSFIILVLVSLNISKSRTRIDNISSNSSSPKVAIFQMEREFAIPNNFFRKFNLIILAVNIIAYRIIIIILFIMSIEII